MADDYGKTALDALNLGQFKPIVRRAVEVSSGKYADAIILLNSDGSIAQLSSVGGVQTVGGVSRVWVDADATLTRPANVTAYAANQGIGSSSSCLFKFTGFWRKNANTGLLTGMRLTASAAGIAASNMGTVRAHILNASPSSPPASDQAAYTSLAANRLIKQGYADFSVWDRGGTGSDLIDSYGTMPYTVQPAQAAAGAADLWVLLVATGAFTPIASAVIGVQLAGSLD